jgi:uncharacterized protein (DUF362 family)
MDSARDTSHLIRRREFLRRAAWAGGGIAATGATGWLLHDSSPPPALPPGGPSVAFPDFLPAAPGPSMAVVHGTDRARTCAKALDLLGGIGRFVRDGDRVAIKVNAAFASPPAIGATTHPDLVSETVRQCLSAGAASVIVLDNPINDPATCFQRTGIAAAATAAGARVVLPSKHLFEPVSLERARFLRDWPAFTAPLEGFNRIIGLAPVKDHHRSGASMTLKNWYGFIGGRRNIFHQHIHPFIAELARMVRPTLVLLDGTQTMMTNGPTGGSMDDLRTTRTMIASTDPVAADAFGGTLLDRTAGSLPFLAMAEAAGAGTVNYRSLNPIIADLP